jgi:hypothetical protein
MRKRKTGEAGAATYLNIGSRGAFFLRIDASQILAAAKCHRIDVLLLFNVPAAIFCSPDPPRG